MPSKPGRAELAQSLFLALVGGEAARWGHGALNVAADVKRAYDIADAFLAEVEKLEAPKPIATPVVPLPAVLSKKK